MEIAGNTVRPRRPVSAAGLRRPESEYARQRKGFDPSARYKYENVLGAELDPQEKGVEEYEGPGMVSAVLSAGACGHMARPLHGTHLTGSLVNVVR